MTVQFVIPGPPKGKARARTLKNGHSYTPKETVQYENLVKLCYREVSNEPPHNGPVEVIISALYPIPKSASNKKHRLMLEGSIRPTVKPDCDNVAKMVCDALNGIAYRDDSQVVSCNVSKSYWVSPQVEVTLSFLEVC